MIFIFFKTYYFYKNYLIFFINIKLYYTKIGELFKKNSYNKWRNHMNLIEKIAIKLYIKKFNKKRKRMSY